MFAKFAPYWELMRVRMFTTIIMFAPYLYGSLFAASLSASRISIDELLKINLKLILSALLSHSWACTWNDVADYKFDRQVRRCAKRPIARGAVSPQAGAIWAAAQLLLWIQYHRILLPQYSIYGALAVLLAILYPFSKRVTNYTPVLLGIIFAFGTPLGYASTGGSVDQVLAQPWHGLWKLGMYTFTWVVNFETIYAFQDLQDDEKAGVKSMAVKYRGNAKLLFGICIVLETVLLVQAGQAMEAGFGYYLLAPVANACLQAHAQLRLDLKDAEECTRFFKLIPVSTFCLVGSGFFAQYLSS